MKELMLLASYVVSVSHFTYTALATPVESHAFPDASVLLARQTGTYSGSDALNASLPGTFNCYKGGTWALQSALDTPINEICGAPAYEPLQITPLSFTPNADHAYPQQLSVYQLDQACTDVSLNCDSDGQNGKVSIYFTSDIASSQHANMADCEYALGRVRDICHGKNGYTRGGWFTFNSDQTTYGFDPTRNGNGQ